MLTRQGVSRLTQAEFQSFTDINIGSPARAISLLIVYRPLEFIMAEKTVATIHIF
jgi:hypothetical protein